MVQLSYMEILFVPLIFMGFAAAAIIAWLFKLYRILIYTVALKQIGYNLSAIPEEFIKELSLPVGSFAFDTYSDTGLYEGSHKGARSWFIDFYLPKNNFGSKHYNGAIFETMEMHETLQIHDINSAFVPILDTGTTTESVEFDNTFKIISNDPKNPYYQLSPSAMANLISLRNKFGHPFNIHFYKNFVLIYSLEKKIQPGLRSLLKIIEVIRHKTNSNVISDISTQIQNKINLYYELYQDIKLKG